MNTPLVHKAGHDLKKQSVGGFFFLYKSRTKICLGAAESSLDEDIRTADESGAGWCCRPSGGADFDCS
jgi:hypothetical protein